MQGLANLDAQFEAVFAGDRVRALFGDATSELIRCGALADGGMSTTIPHCICELRRPDCVVRLDAVDGRHLGFCNEYGRPIAIEPDQVRRYLFDWKAWAAALRKKNHLNGAGPALGKGCLFVGAGTVADRPFRLAIVAPDHRRRGGTLLPPEAQENSAPIVTLVLGAGRMGEHGGVIADVDVIEDDAVTLRDDRLEELLLDAPLVITEADLTHQVYSHEHPRGQPITEAECDRLRRKEVREGYDLFIDLTLNKVWRKARACATELDSAGRSTGRTLGQTSINLLADYVRRPGRAMVPGNAPTYRDANTTARSASVRLAAVRRSVRGARFLSSVTTGADPGTGTYAFEPGDMTYCVVERIPAPR